MRRGTSASEVSILYAREPERRDNKAPEMEARDLYREENPSYALHSDADRGSRRRVEENETEELSCSRS